MMTMILLLFHIGSFCKTEKRQSGTDKSWCVLPFVFQEKAHQSTRISGQRNSKDASRRISFTSTYWYLLLLFIFPSFSVVLFVTFAVFSVFTIEGLDLSDFCTILTDILFFSLLISSILFLMCKFASLNI